MNAFQSHTSVTAGRLTAHMAIQILITELRAADAIIRALDRLTPQNQRPHGNKERAAEGAANTLRSKERTAVITMAGGFPSPAPSLLTSQDLIRRLRSLAGQRRAEPSALELDAADQIEKLEAWIALHLPPHHSPQTSMA